MAAVSPSTTRLVKGICILLVIAFGAAGSAKLTGVPQMVAVFDAIGIGQWFRYMTGSIEVLGAVMLIIPTTRLYAGLMLGATMVGATLSHLIVVPGSPLPAIILGLLCATVVWSSRPARFRSESQTVASAS